MRCDKCDSEIEENGGYVMTLKEKFLMATMLFCSAAVSIAGIVSIVRWVLSW